MPAVLGLAAGGYYFYRRVLTDNFGAVVPGRVYRSAQPSPEDLKRWARRYGLKTVVNLRGQSSLAFYRRERRAARQAGLKMFDVRFSAISHPPVPELEKLIRILEDKTLHPLLIHCEGGADRTGVASVLAAMAVGQQPYHQAREELSLARLHLGSDPDQIEGFLERYEQWCRRQGWGTGGWEQFRRWSLEVYHPYYYSVQIEAPCRVQAHPGQQVRVCVEVTNRAAEAIPAGDPQRIFRVAAYLGDPYPLPERRRGCTRLPRRDLLPGRTVKVSVPFRVPERRGTYRLHFDVVEEHETWFARQGSPVSTHELIVAELAPDR